MDANGGGPLLSQTHRRYQADVCIVGAGIAGMTTAYLLAREGKSVIVIDDGPIGARSTRSASVNPARCAAANSRSSKSVDSARRSTEAYVKADLALTFSPNRSWSIFGVLANFTNAKYEDYVGFRAPGTNFRLGMTYRD
jgi:glycine/D-amino acid oxidase-like deaminating enzyme